MKADYRFEPAGEADFEALLALRILVMRPHLERLGRFDPNRARARFRAGFAPSDTSKVMIGGAMAGMVTLGRVEDGIALKHFYLHPDFQGRGLGSAILTDLIRDAGDQAMMVEVLKQSPALTFYQRHGFEITHEEEWDIYLARQA